MAINVIYDIPASMLGAVGLGTGAGVRAERESVRARQEALARDELGQRERLEGNRVAASRANAFLGVAANAASQQYARDTAERARLFDHAAGQHDRAQAAGLQGQFAQQQAELQRRRDAEGFGRDVAMETYQAELARRAEEAKQAGRLDFAVREREQQAAEIRRQGELRKQTVRGGIQAGTVRPQDGERRIAAIEDEISMSIGGLSGAEFDVSTLPPTPQEELARSFEDEVHVDEDGNKWVKNKDGVWGPPRGWKPPEDPEKAKAEREAKERETRLKEQSERARTYRELLSGFLDETVKGGPGEPPRQKYTPEQAAEMAADLMARADRFAYGPDWQGPVQPGQEMPLPGHHAPFGTPDPRTEAPPAGVPLGGETHRSVPREAPETEAETQAEPGRRTPEQIRHQPVRDFQDIVTDHGGVAPEDLTPAELRSTGSGALARPPREMPPGVADEIGDLRSLFNRNVADAGGKDAAAARAIDVYAGAVMAYGPDPMAWPQEVRASMLEEAALVYQLKQRGE